MARDRTPAATAAPRGLTMRLIVLGLLLGLAALGGVYTRLHQNKACAITQPFASKTTVRKAVSSTFTGATHAASIGTLGTTQPPSHEPTTTAPPPPSPPPTPPPPPGAGAKVEAGTTYNTLVMTMPAYHEIPSGATLTFGTTVESGTAAVRYVQTYRRTGVLWVVGSLGRWVVQ